MNYLYVIQLPVARRNGEWVMARPAALDLLSHRRLLSAPTDLILAAPVLDASAAAPPGEPLDPVPGVCVVPLVFENSLAEGIRSLPANFIRLWRAVRRADFVHTGSGGFPFFLSPCFLAHVLAVAMRRPSVFVMDCDLVGKLETDQVATASGPLKRWIWRAFARLSWRLYTGCLKTAAVSFLLGGGVVSRYGPYARRFLEIYQPIIGPEFLIPAPDFAAKRHAVAGGAPLGLCFAGRLAVEKGCEVLVRAAAILRDKGVAVTVHVYGDGPQRQALTRLARQLGVDALVSFHGHISWGAALFEQLRRHCIQVVPHLTLEMTRNVFDGMASGCALAASDTPALAKLLRDAGSGTAFATGDAGDLARVIEGFHRDRRALCAVMGRAVDFVRKNHRDAHVARRLAFLARQIDGFERMYEADRPDSGRRP